jgi:hypothetical protein
MCSGKWGRWYAPVGWVCLLPVALLLLLLVPESAQAKTSVGARIGWADVNDEVFEGSGDLGGTDLYGIQVTLSLLTLFELEVAGEYVNEDFSFDFLEDVGHGEYEDIALYATLRAPVFALPVLPIQIYAGGGLNVHWVDRTIEVPGQTLRLPGARSAPPGHPPGIAARLLADGIEETIEDVAGEDSEAGWHAVAGARLGFPGMAITIFAEGRYMDGFDEGLPASKAVYAGVSLGL